MIDDAAEGLPVVIGERQRAQPALSSLHTHDGER
jgi:hypothetical protein